MSSEDEAKRLASLLFPAQVQAQVGNKRRREKGDSWKPNVKAPGGGCVLHSRDPGRQHAGSSSHNTSGSTREVIDLSSSPDLSVQTVVSDRVGLAPRPKGAVFKAGTASAQSLHALGRKPPPLPAEVDFCGFEDLLQEEKRWEELQRIAQLPRNALSMEAAEQARRERDEIKDTNDDDEGEAKWQINYPTSYKPIPKQKPTAWEIQKAKLDLEKAKARAQYEAKKGAAGSDAHGMPAPALSARFIECGQESGLATKAEDMDLNFDLYADKGRRKPTAEGPPSSSGLSSVEHSRLENGAAHSSLASDAVRYALRAKRAQHVQHVLEFSASTVCGESERNRAHTVTQALKNTNRGMEEFYRCALGIASLDQRKPAPKIQAVGGTFRSETHYIETFGPLVLEEMLRSAEADLRGNSSTRNGPGRQRQSFDVRCYKVYADGSPVLSLNDSVDVTSNATLIPTLLQLHVCSASREDLSSDAASSTSSSIGVNGSYSRSMMDRLPQEELCVVLYNSEAVTPSSANLAHIAQSSSSFLCVIGRAGIDESVPVLFCLKSELQRAMRQRGWGADPCGTWHVVSLLSLMTSAREWAALQSIRYEQLMPLGPYLLNAAPVVSATTLIAVRDKIVNKLDALKRVWYCLAEENEDEHHRNSTDCNKLILRCSQVINSILLDLEKLREMSVDSSVLVKTGIVKTLKQELQKSEVLREYLEEAEICEEDGDKDAAVAVRKVASCCKEILKQWAANVKFAENERIKAMKGLPSKPRTAASDTDLPLNAGGVKILSAHTVEKPIHLPEALWSALCQRLNASQLAAVRYIGDADGKPTDMQIALLQGPPGTGKTTTVIGMISVLLLQSAANEKLCRNNSSKKPRVLLCTPSNTACDELLLRLMKPGAVLNAAGTPKSLRIVRLGRSHWEEESQNDSERIISDPTGRYAEKKAVAELSLEFQTDDRLKKTMEYAAFVACREELSALQRSAISGDAKVAESAQRVRCALFNVEQQLERLRFHIRADILRDSDVVAGTLSGTGQSHFVNFMVTHDIQFDTCIIDEAAQTSEPSTLIPLQYGCKRLVLVGDPKQLPATIHSTVAKSAGLDRSLFERLHSQGHNKFMLTIQYRMHPSIRAFPSQRFYGGLLADAHCILDEISARTQTRRIAVDNTRYCIFGNQDYLQLHASRPGLPGFTSPESIRVEAVNFFDIRSFEDSRRKSFQNEPEALFCSYLAFELSKQLSGRSIAILTPYSGQRALLGRCLELLSGDTTLASVEINTVDGFQGREADVVIFSCVRSGLDGIGFLSDERRLNVAITRARGCLIIVGNSSLVRGKGADDWKALHQHLAAQGRITSVATTPWM